MKEIRSLVLTIILLTMSGTCVLASSRVIAPSRSAMLAPVSSKMDEMRVLQGKGNTRPATIRPADLSDDQDLMMHTLQLDEDEDKDASAVDYSAMIC
ncbi:MAG: hypothetical protein P4L33_12740 [Capsulimonadaceae bacterium]|nr:hypothetical protein [Capsulimonadaceae bacterium]